MKHSFLFILLVVLLSTSISCGTSGSKEAEKKEQDSIALAERMRADSIAKIERIRADSIARVEKHIADSIAEVRRIEREANLRKLSKNFRERTDEFSNSAWVEHTSTPKYRNRNSIHLSFEKTGDHASNLRFVIQYEDENWLFIQNIIFNIDGENITFYPDKMERDCGYGGRIWEWSDERASNNLSLVNKIANAKKVKLKLNGKQYYDTRTMSASQIQGFKETLEYYMALGGTL